MSKKIIPDLVPVSKPATTVSDFSKWIPLICAGAAVGVGIIALKEIKNIRKELILVKTDIPKPQPLQQDPRFEIMDTQLKKITEYLKNNQSSGIIKNAVKKSNFKKVKIINEPEPEPAPVQEDPEEFEEVEVTDSESDE